MIFSIEYESAVLRVTFWATSHTLWQQFKCKYSLTRTLHKTATPFFITNFRFWSTFDSCKRWRQMSFLQDCHEPWSYPISRYCWSKTWEQMSIIQISFFRYYILCEFLYTGKVPVDFNIFLFSKKFSFTEDTFHCSLAMFLLLQIFNSLQHSRYSRVRDCHIHPFREDRENSRSSNQPWVYYLKFYC